MLAVTVKKIYLMGWQVFTQIIFGDYDSITIQAFARLYKHNKQNSFSSHVSQLT